jgi:hypothetical protein
MPPNAGRFEIASDFDSAAQAADQLFGRSFDRQQPGDRLAVFGDNDTVGIEAVEDGETLFLESGGANFSHDLFLS